MAQPPPPPRSSAIWEDDAPQRRVDQPYPGTRPRAKVPQVHPAPQGAAAGTEEWIVVGPGEFDWDPEKHPRDERGRFGGGDGDPYGDRGDQPWMDQGAPWSEGGPGSNDAASYYDNPSPYEAVNLAPPWERTNSSVHQAMAEVNNGPGRPDGTGTKDDPIAVGADIELAAQLISEGKHVRLDQPDQVTVLLDKVKELAADAKARGEKAPEYNLCNVTVPGTNLFCQENLDIPRNMMPQLTGIARPGSHAAGLRRDPNDPTSEADITRQFREALEVQEGVKVTDSTMLASHLRSTQNQLDGVKVAGIAGAMKAGVPGVADTPANAIFVTRDGYIIDGHHRWAAKIANDVEDGAVGDITMPVKVVDMDIGTALDYANAFAETMGIVPKGMAGAGDANLKRKAASAEAQAFAEWATDYTVLGLGRFPARTGPPPFAA